MKIIQILYVQQTSIYNMLHVAQELSIPSDFSLYFKATMTRIIHQILRWKKMQMILYVDILIPALAHCAQISLHVCGVEPMMYVL
jgi:hypothetical protein